MEIQACDAGQDDFECRCCCCTGECREQDDPDEALFAGFAEGEAEPA
jgi:hypothetical protein